MGGQRAAVAVILGGYYYGEHTTSNSATVLFGGGVNYFNKITTKNSSYAPFGQVTWTPPILSDKLSITAGLRYSEDHVHSTVNHRCINVTAEVAPGIFMNVCNLGIPGLVSFRASVGKGFRGSDGLTPMANIAYQWTETLMTYVRVSRGFQSGAVNDAINDQRLLSVTNPEKLWSYEAGFKSQWFDNRLRLNADGFLSRYSDQVVPVEKFSPTAGEQTTNENAGTSEFWGSEVEATAIPFRGLEATLNYAYLSAKYLEWTTQQFINGVPQFDANGNPIKVNVASERKVPYAPEHTVTLGLTYTAPPTTAGVFAAHIDMFWTDSFVGHPEPPYPDADWAYAVFNGRLQFVDIPLEKGSLDLSVWGRNLFDRKYRTNGFSLGGLGWFVDAYGDPRTFGLGLTYHFTAS